MSSENLYPMLCLWLAPPFWHNARRWWRGGRTITWEIGSFFDPAYENIEQTHPMNIEITYGIYIYNIERKNIL